MSDKSVFQAMLSGAGVIYREHDNHHEDEIAKGQTIIEINSWDGEHQDGYASFFVQFRFAADESLEFVSIWE